MFRKTLSALTVVTVLLAGIALFVWLSGDTTKTYVNEVHGYSVSYPRDYDIREYGAENAVIGRIAQDAIEGKVEIRTVTIHTEAGQSLEDAVAEQLKNLCAADGPSASFACTSTQSAAPFVSETGEEGFVLVLRGELKDLTTGTTTIHAKGPYYVFTLGVSTTISSALVIHAPLNQTLAEADVATIRAVAASVRLQ